MALPMLVGGAECGPSNPLQSLSKRFDQDRGIQQDFFGLGRTGSSKQVFRTQQTDVLQDPDAARFFAEPRPLAPKLAADAAVFDLSVIHAALPTPAAQASQQQQQQQQQQHDLSAAWAADFMNQQGPQNQRPLGANSSEKSTSDTINRHASPAIIPHGMSWGSTLRMNSMPTFAPQISHVHQQQPAINTKSIFWDQEFHAQEIHLASEASNRVQEPTQAQQQKSTPVIAPDELAQTAGLLLENLKHEQSAKFKNSQFIGLMKQLRDGDVVVDGNTFVGSGERASADVKGKGRAIEVTPASERLDSAVGVLTPGVDVLSIPQGRTGQRDVIQEVNNQGAKMGEEDVNAAYFRQENEDFIRYWTDRGANEHAPPVSTSDWDKLQDDWDRFEVTATGIKPVEGYRLQKNNPYLLADYPKMTRHHLMHSGHRSTAMESILELEAAVQRNLSDAGAWYELGVKQQENEREDKALQALQRAVMLDPTHLPSWLALATSYTNDNNHQGTYDAIYEWVSRNAKYESAVRTFRALRSESLEMTLAERHSELVQCLIAMVTSGGGESGEVDADIQIALAVLLNTSEEYAKALDCFTTALAVRPDDWLLYNRVGATMANSGKADLALDYYYRALELNPGYIRARFNLGISFLSLRRYEEATQQILDALVLQESDGLGDDDSSRRGVAPSVMWDTLRATCMHLQRSDLGALCDERDLEGIRNNFA